MRKLFIVLAVFSILFLATPAFAGSTVTYAQAPASTPTPTPVGSPTASGTTVPTQVTPTQSATGTSTNSASPASGAPASGAPASGAAASSTCSNPYTVQAGDTLTSIAQKCGVDYTTLLNANSSFTTPDLILPGQTVNIPQGSSVPVTGGTGQTSNGTYTVVSGDWLSTIASRFNTTVQSIVNVNPWISNPNLIFPGWVITLPSGSSSTPGIPTTGGTGSTSGKTYTVVSGDTLSSIAQRFNTTTGALMSANTWITNPNVIVPGWVIAVP